MTKQARTTTPPSPAAADRDRREERRCHCGSGLETCRDCGGWRCPRCDPYRSEDCYG